MPDKPAPSMAGIFASLLIIGVLCVSYAADITERSQARVFRKSSAAALPYRLLSPVYSGTATKYPLILFLHGAGERGSDNTKQLHAGLNIFADEKIMKRFPCFIAAPQCPTDMKWVDVDWEADRHRMKNKPTEALAMALELVKELQKEFPIDSDRIYVTGYSMGGFGAWEAIQREPEFFAAAVPVCGGGDVVEAVTVSRVPVWAFHGALDTTVKVARSRNMINAIVMAGGMPRYTEYATINHFSWGRAFSDQAMFTWLFSQKKSKAYTR